MNAKRRLVKNAINDMREAWIAVAAEHESYGSAKGSWGLRGELVGFQKDGETIACDAKRRNEVFSSYEQKIKLLNGNAAEAEEALVLAIFGDEK